MLVFIFILYNILLLSVFFIGLPIWAFLSFLPKYRSTVINKLFCLDQNASKEESLILIHGVSVGEINAALPLIEGLREKYGDDKILVTTTTKTGYANAKARLKGITIEYFPFDFLPSIFLFFYKRRFLKTYLLETEVWPNFLYYSYFKRIPTYLVNGRLSDHSFPKYLRVRTFLSPLLNSYRFIYCQGEEDRKRFLSLGVKKEKISRLSSMKFDSACLLKEKSKERFIPHTCEGLNDARVFLGASLHQSEIAPILTLFTQVLETLPGSRMILVPRKPECLNDYDNLFNTLPFKVLRRSKMEYWSWDWDCLVVDTMGELFDLYYLAQLIFVGKSMEAPGGGQNPIEPAVLGRHVVVGPYYQNFRAIVNEMEEEKAIEVSKDWDDLKNKVISSLNDLSASEKFGKRALEYVKKNTGASSKIIQET